MVKTIWKKNNPKGNLWFNNKGKALQIIKFTAISHFNKPNTIKYIVSSGGTEKIFKTKAQALAYSKNYMK